MRWNPFKEKRVHLDYASTTPVHPEVFEAMRPYFSDLWANPSALYREGVRARQAVEGARAELARLLHVRPEGITFTSGGTESNNLAILGVVEARHRAGVPYGEMEILSTEIEHPSVLETLREAERRGVAVAYVAVDGDGVIDLRDLASKLTPKAVLVTCAYVNSEVGTVQDVKALTRLIRKWNGERGTDVLVHLDASQAPLWLPCELDRLGVDLLTLDAGKCYGPKGAGVLARTHGTPLAPVLFGGGQEGGLRSGTENTALIVGCVKAIARAAENHEARSAAVAALRDELFDLLLTKIPRAVVNGSRESRVANNVNISIPGLDSEYAVVWLDEHGVACATRSACGTGGKDGSAVVRNMTGDDARARSTLRFTLGEETKSGDLGRTVGKLAEHRALMGGADV